MSAVELAPLLALDGPFLLYRSFFAMPESITGIEDRPVGALLGALNLTLRIAADTRPRAVIVCWGAEAAAYRTELYPPYHAARPEPPDALAWQFAQAPALFDAFGWTSASDPLHEADDVLHSLALAETRPPDPGRALLVTGDRDMYQCATDRVQVLYLRMGGKGVEEVDPAEVRARYGVDPAQVPDFIALRGDPSDGLPGAPGIGPKTAATLLAAHGDLDGAIAAAAEHRPRVAAALRDHSDELRAFREIATLRDLALDRPANRATDLQAGAAAARQLGLRRLAERLGAAETLADLA